MAKQPTWEQWLRRIRDGEEWVKILRQQSEPYRKAFAGDFPPPFPKEDDSSQVYVNRIHRVVIQWRGAMYAQDPKIYLDPPDYALPDMRKRLNLNATILNTEIRRIGLEDPVKEAIQAAFLDGWGWVKEGFHVEFDIDAEEAEAVTSNVDSETYAFALMEPSLFPSSVLLSEDHQEHIPRHIQQVQELTAKTREISMAVQPIIAAGGQTDPIVEKEIGSLQQTAQALKQHISLHQKAVEERYKTGGVNANVRIRAENCWVDSVHNSNVVWDLQARNPDDWRWVAERLIKPVSEFRDNAKFTNRSKIEANFTTPRPGSVPEEGDSRRGSGVHSETLRPTVGQDSDDPDALAAVWKIYNLEHRQILYLHEPVEGKFLYKDVWPHKFLRGPPLNMLYFELEADFFKPIPQAKYIWSQQLELNRYRTKAGIITRRANRFTVTDRRINSEDLDSMADAKDGDYIQVDTPIHKSLQDLFLPVNWGSVPIDVHQLAAQAENDIEMDSALGGVQLGSGIKAKTATAAQVQKESTGVNLDEKLRCIERFVIRVVSNIRDLMRQYYTEGRFVETFQEGEVGGIPEKVVKQWVGEDLEDFRIRVEMGSSRRQERDLEKMQWLQLLQILSKVPGINLVWLSQRILEMYGVRNPDEAFIDMLTQMQQQAQPGMGPGQGQNQQSMPPSGGRAEIPAQDRSKIGPPR